MAVWRLLWLATLIGLVLADKLADKIDNLPGVNFQVSFNQYSGFLPTQAGNSLHYWFVESQGNPATDPLILWLNGGPGCSSIGGLFTELGPFRVNSDGKTIFENVYSWNKAANVIFMEAPRGVGYSYRDPSLKPDNVYNDDKSAADNADAVLAFIDRFAEYKNRSFFVTGESYGGIYVPTLSRELIRRQLAGKAPGLNMQGFAVGNGMLNYKNQINSVIDLLYYRGMYGMDEFEQLRSCCAMSSHKPLAYCDFSQYVTVSPHGGTVLANDYGNNTELTRCANLVVSMGYDRVWETINDVYNTNQDCYMDSSSPNSMRAMKQSHTSRRRGLKAANALNAFVTDGTNNFVDQGAKINTGSTDSQGGFPCWMDAATQNYMRLPAVRQALHIPNWLPPWSDCNDTVGDLYYWQTLDDTPVFEEMFKSGKPLGILIYNGDLDTACNFLGDEWFVEGLADKNGFVKSKRTDWMFSDAKPYEEQLAGYQKHFSKGNINMHFLTVKGAGHFVPLDRAGPSLQMITNFLNNTQDYNQLVPYNTDAKPLLPQFQPPPPPKYTRKEAARVWNLPGLTFNINFKQYSGYLKAMKGNYLHYWFVESQSNPSKDPLVLWLTGGPGCSSVLALLAELGPYWLNRDSITLTENVFAWNKEANVIFLESPRNVGFSYQNYTENPDRTYSDSKTAMDNFMAIMDFLTVFPEYKNREFYVSGESYAGVYVPTLVSLMIDNIQAGKAPGLNLTGTSVGNGKLSSMTSFNSIPNLLYNRAMYGEDVMKLLAFCCPNKSEPLQYCNLAGYFDFDEHGSLIPKEGSPPLCAQYLPYFAQAFVWEMSQMQDVYNMYQDCYMETEYVFGSLPMDIRRKLEVKSKLKPKLRLKPKFELIDESLKKMKHPMRRFMNHEAKMNYASTDSQGGYMCYSTNAAVKYLGTEDVRDALHIPPQVQAYSVCNDDINYNYVQQNNDMTPVFEHIVKSGYKLKFLVYNGDLDTACNFMGDEWFVESLATKMGLLRSENWQPWSYMGQYAGYSTAWQYGAGSSLYFLTVKGAGHMVPTDRPGPALQMYHNFLKGNLWSLQAPFMSNIAPLKPQYQVQAQLASSVVSNPVHVTKLLSKRQPRRAHKWNPVKPISKVADPPQGSKQADQIISLPGLTFPIDFKQYSGYLPATKGNFLHYWLVESQLNPETAPLVLWLNGGPGCSSISGLMEEFGPFKPNPDGKTLFENQFSWNKLANVIFLESPRDVGYSYRSSSASVDSMYNDDKTALDNVLALKSFFARYPEYNNRDFYITGESYAGIYIPTLTSELIKQIQNRNITNMNLKGVAIGNGEISEEQQISSAPQLLYYRGVIGKSQFDELKPCCMVNGKYDNHCQLHKFITLDHWGKAHPIQSSDPVKNKCAQLVVQFGFNSIWQTLNDPYNTYQDCYVQSQDGVSTRRKRSVPSLGGIPVSHNYSFINQANLINKKSTDASWSFPCFNDAAMINYMNLPDVQKALHIPQGLPKWSDCTDFVSANYYQQHHDTMPVFKDIINSKYPLRMLIYNGDADTVCNFLGDEWFIESLAKSYKMKATARNHWNYTLADSYLPRIGGYVKRFTNSASMVIDLLTVKGAGHFVPMDRPGPALQMISAFIKKQPYSTIAAYDLTLKPMLPQYAPVPGTQVSRMQANRIYDLPGLTYALNFEQYSGYLQATPGNYLHYWFVESQGSSSTDPVIVWLNGGPGCSALGGLLTELGPFRPNPDGRTLFENVFSWNKAANVLFLESPRLVGFSYQDESLNSDLQWDDSRTAMENAMALDDFFTVFPQFSQNEFYIAGESYAGVYIPATTALLIQRIQSGKSQINLKGISIGNGALSDINEVRANADFLYFRGIYGMEDWNELIECCPNYGPPGSEPPLVCHYDDYVHIDEYANVIPKNSTDPKFNHCAQLVCKLQYHNVWHTLNDQYNLYQDCYHQDWVPTPFFKESMKNLKNLKKKLFNKLIRQSPRNYKSAYSKMGMAYVNKVSTDAAGGFQCYMNRATWHYLNQTHVRDALHVPQYAQPWTDCSDVVGEHYKQLYNDTTPVLQKIVDSNYPLRVLIYNGDADSVCNIFEAQYTIEGLVKANDMMSSTRQPWYYQLASEYRPSIAGYQKTFTKGSIQIDLLTVKGAGHFVPTDRPGPALQMITNFVRNTQDYSSMTLLDTKRAPLLPQFQPVTTAPVTTTKTPVTTTKTPVTTTKTPVTTTKTPVTTTKTPVTTTTESTAKPATPSTPQPPQTTQEPTTTTSGAETTKITQACHMILTLFMAWALY